MLTFQEKRQLFSASLQNALQEQFNVYVRYYQVYPESQYRERDNRFKLNRIDNFRNSNEEN